LKYGGKVTTATVDRVRRFMVEIASVAAANGADALKGFNSALLTASASHETLPPQQNFRFYDNRQKYLMFVNTCSEEWVVADRIALELDQLRPRPPAIRVFDAGVGDGTVLARVMRQMHRRFEKYPLYIVGKEISLEDVRLTLEKTPDRLF